MHPKTYTKKNMDEEDMTNEMPVPSYAVGIRILLIDPDIASLGHTTLMLEESTYRVTSIAVPDVALSMIRERANGYDLIVAATNMQGMDCLTFLKNLMILSDTPIVLISYEVDFQLAATTLQQGVCHFLEKPLKRNEARALWQFVFRKPRKSNLLKTKSRVFNNDSKQKKNLTTNYKGKGKKILVQSHNKRKILENSDGDNNYTRKAQISNFMSNGNETNEGRNKKVNANNSNDSIKWSPQLHEKFMKVLTTDDTLQANSKAREARGTPDMTMMRMPQPAYHPQSSYRDINDHISNSTTQISGIDNLNEQRQLQLLRYQGCENPSSMIGANSTHIDTNLWNSGTMLSPQSQNLFNNSHILEHTPNFFNQQYNPQFNTTNFGAINLPYYSTSSDKFCGDFMAQGLNFDTQSDIFESDKSDIGTHPSQSLTRAGEVINKQHDSFGSSELRFNLKGRIDQIRREYWAKGKSESAGIHTKNMSSGHIILNQEPHMLLNPDLQNGDEKQTNVSSGTIIGDLGESNPGDDIFLDEIFAELRDDFADDDLKTMGFNATDNVQCRR